MRFTHKGWFGLCPVYISRQPEGEHYTFIYKYTEWLFDLSNDIFAFIAAMVYVFTGDDEYDVKVVATFTKELDEPFEVDENGYVIDEGPLYIKPEHPDYDEYLYDFIWGFKVGIDSVSGGKLTALGVASELIEVCYYDADESFFIEQEELRTFLIFER
jgi:hypothetical protein